MNIATYRTVSRRRARLNIRRSRSRANRYPEPRTVSIESVPPTFVDLPPKAPDVDLDDVRLCGEVGVPKRVDQPIPGEDLAGMPGQELEQRELARGQADRSSGASDAERRRIQLEVANLDRRRAILEPTPAERADPGPQLVHAEGLREVVVGAAIESGDPVLHVVERGQHQDRAPSNPRSRSAAHTAKPSSPGRMTSRSTRSYG